MGRSESRERRGIAEVVMLFDNELLLCVFRSRRSNGEFGLVV
jgi:hypothetical protein